MIFHIAETARWERARAAGSAYAPDSLGREGFVHASTRAQVLATAARLFAGRTDLTLLCLDPDRLEAEVRYEDLLGEGQLFPHVYGPVPLAAVVAALPFLPGPEGRFRLPPGTPPEPSR